ncbi:MAG TPA: hypothetical protein VK796_13285 [Cytophaga sp.]|nr:hypothetical protein [Cytophaga sp.]
MNKCILAFLFVVCLFLSSIQLRAQRDSVLYSSQRYERISGASDLAIGRVRGFVPGDSITTVLRSEKAILEAQGDDFLYYRVLCDSILSVEIAYTFDEKKSLISIGIEFFESCKHSVTGFFSEEFSINLLHYYGESVKDETGFLQWKTANGVQIEYQKMKNDACILHTQIEFY